MKIQVTGKRACALFIFAVMPCFVHAQNRQAERERKKEIIQNKIQAQRFTFSAQQVIPMRGRSRNVTTDNYDLKITPDTVIAYLPYFGRAYIAPIDPSRGGIQFTSTKFRYSKAAAKKGGWNIMIKPEDVRDVRQLSLSISSDGYASLQVISNHRDPISFNGVIGEK